MFTKLAHLVLAFLRAECSLVIKCFTPSRVSAQSTLAVLSTEVTQQNEIKSTTQSAQGSRYTEKKELLIAESVKAHSCQRVQLTCRLPKQCTSVRQSLHQEAQQAELVAHS